jgi:hypothetical protein
MLDAWVSGRTPDQVQGEPADISGLQDLAEFSMRRIVREMIGEMAGPNRERVELEKARLERLYAFKRRKLSDQIGMDWQRLRKMQMSGEERHRKVAPAIEGRIEKARRELDGLEGERAARMAELQMRLDMVERHRVVGAVVLQGEYFR